MLEHNEEIKNQKSINNEPINNEPVHQEYAGWEFLNMNQENKEAFDKEALEKKVNRERFENFNEFENDTVHEHFNKIRLGDYDDLDFYLERGNLLDSIQHYEGFASDKKLKGNDHRKEKGRKSKYKKSAEYMKKADKLIQESEKKKKDSEVVFAQLDALELRLKGLRYVAEGNALDKNDEELRKAKVELKVRGAQLDLIQDRKHYLIENEKENTSYFHELIKREEEIRTKYRKYKENYDIYSKKLGESDTYRKRRAAHAKLATGNNQADYVTDAYVEKTNLLKENSKYYRDFVIEYGKKYGAEAFVNDKLVDRAQFIWAIDFIKFDTKGRVLPGYEKIDRENKKNLELLIKCNAKVKDMDKMEEDGDKEYDQVMDFLEEKFTKWFNTEQKYIEGKSIKDNPEMNAQFFINSRQQVIFENGVHDLEIFKYWCKKNNITDECLSYISTLSTLRTHYDMVINCEMNLHGVKMNFNKEKKNYGSGYFMTNDEYIEKNDLNDFKKQYEDQLTIFKGELEKYRKKAEKGDIIAKHRLEMIENPYENLELADYIRMYEEFKDSGQKFYN